MSHSKIKKFQQHPLTLFCQEQFVGLTLFLLATQVMLFVLAFFFRMTHFLLWTVLMVITISFYVLVKDGVKERSLRVGGVLTKTSLIFSLLTLLHLTLLPSLIPMVSSGKLPPSFITMVFFVLDAMAFIIMIIVLKKPRVKEQLTLLESKSIFDNMMGEEIKSGDTILGIDEETKKPVRLPLEDRFLHMLLIGPTGSGKTALSLTPMIWRDMQCPDLGIVCIEPKGDFAEKVYAMAKMVNREVVYFNPMAHSCPYFNPLYGDETEVIENISTTFAMFNAGSSQFFQDANDGLLRRALKVVKRVKGNDATLTDLSMLIHNANGEGKKMVQQFQRIPVQNADEEQEKMDIALWFLDDYFTGISGKQGATKTYEHTSAVRKTL